MNKPSHQETSRCRTRLGSRAVVLSHELPRARGAGDVRVEDARGRRASVGSRVRRVKRGATVVLALLLAACAETTPSPDYPHASGTPRELLVDERTATPEMEAAAEPRAEDVWIGADAPPLGTSSSQTAEGVSPQAQASAQPVFVTGDGDEYADTDPSALWVFRDALAPYGDWEDDATYGVVWYPRASVVGEDFVPYVSAGRWTYTNEYVWVSDYPWGWAPFHYGRWVYVPARGWAWIPGRRYAGAWVVWRTASDPAFGYVGWGPMPPAWYWHGGVAVSVGFGSGGWYAGPAYPPFFYCPTAYLFAPRVYTHVVYGPRSVTIAERTRPYAPPEAPRVAASPTVSDRVAARPVVSPSPRELGIPAPSVVAPPARDASLARATQLARPSTSHLAEQGLRRELGLHRISKPELRGPELGATARDPRASIAPGVTRGREPPRVGPFGDPVPPPRFPSPDPISRSGRMQPMPPVDAAPSYRVTPPAAPPARHFQSTPPPPRITPPATPRFAPSVAPPPRFTPPPAAPAPAPRFTPPPAARFTPPPAPPPRLTPAPAPRFTPSPRVSPPPAIAPRFSPAPQVQPQRMQRLGR
jgi:hypothetical protein